MTLKIGKYFVLCSSFRGRALFLLLLPLVYLCNDGGGRNKLRNFLIAKKCRINIQRDDDKTLGNFTFQCGCRIAFSCKLIRNVISFVFGGDSSVLPLLMRLSIRTISGFKCNYYCA